MAKKNNAKRTERMQKGTRNVNRALSLFTVGFVAEFYLLMINRFYVKGKVEQFLATYRVLEVLLYVGLAAAVAGAVLVWRGKKCARCAAFAPWVLGIGGFLALSSLIMLRQYPFGTTALCVFVPVLMLLAVVALLYQPEFAVQAIALTMTLGVAAMINRSSTNTIARLGVIGGLVVCCGAIALIAMLQKKGGVYTRGEKKVTVFHPSTDYRMMYAVLALCIAALVALIVLAGSAFYVLWATAVVLFLLAVWYTVKML